MLKIIAFYVMVIVAIMLMGIGVRQTARFFFETWDNLRKRNK